MSILEIPAQDYHADTVADVPTLSASIAKLLISQSPAHAKAAHPRLNPNLVRDEDPRFDVGNVSHSLFLQGLETVEVLPYADWRTAAAKEARAEARAHGLIPMLTEQAAEVYAMVNALRTQLEALEIQPALFTDGKPEQTLVWEENGVMCRALLDWLRDDLTAADDLKTTSRSANPEAWCRNTLWSIGADIQVAFHLRGVKAITGAEPEWRFVVAETAPPYAISVISLSPEARALAEAKVDWALTTWKRCLETNEWPAYPTQVCYAEPPGWAESQWLEKEVREAA